MTNRLFRAFGASLIVLSALATAIPASAATMPWTWTDISDQLTVRQNRPIWAMAYASPFWYYTDGQDLWNGGQVYRFDGQTQVNITTDVRSAGLSRVDDIVTDGTNVIFFQDVVRLNNNVQAVMYRNGSYRSITNTLRSSLDSNEGISSIVGRNGIWLMVSTRARLVKFNEDISSSTRLSVPSEIQQISSSNSNLLYSAHNRMDRYATIALAPAGNSFLLAVGPGAQPNTNTTTVFFYRFDGSSFVKISIPETPSDVSGIAFNSSEAIVLSSVAGNRVGIMDAYNGTTWERRATWYGPNMGNGGYRPLAEGSNFSMTWDGSEWMIVSGKSLFRMADTLNAPLEELGQTRDYFVTVASNGSGTIYLGGAVSNLSNTQPTYPLTAKLVKAVVGGTTQTNTTNNTANTTNQSAYGINSWTWIDPSQNYIRRDQNLNFNVGAQSANGIKKIEIVINGATAQTCDLNGSTSNQTCSFSIWGGTYGLGTTVAVNAKVTDNKGASTWTVLQYLTVTAANGTGSNTNNNSVTTNNFGLSAWQWLDPGATTIGRSQNVTFNVGAQHANGLNRVELYVNGTLRKTCSLSSTSANQTCSIQIYGSDYAAGTSVSLNAKVVGTAGDYQQLWTPVMTLTIATDTTVSNQASAYDITAWQWLDPNQNTVRRDQSVTYNISAQNGNGLNRAEIWVNGIVRRSCSLASTASTQTCSLTINGSDYAAGTQIAMNAKVVGMSGEYQQVWTPLLTLTVTDANGTVTTPTTQSTSAPTTWIWVIPPGTNLLTSPASYHVGAWDGENGIRRIEIWVNGNVKRVCSFPDVKTNVECGWDILLGDYPSGSEVFVNAKVEDAVGNFTWAQSQSWRVEATKATTSQYVPNMALYLFNLYKK